MPMKQRITLEQLQELTDEQKERLRDWWKPVYGDFFSNGYWANIIQSEEDGSICCVSTDEDGAYDYEDKKRCLPLLSIGQMVEILTVESSIFNYHMFEDINGNSYNIKGTFKYKANDRYFDYTRTELCDALWDAVKQIL